MPVWVGSIMWRQCLPFACLVYQNVGYLLHAASPETVPLGRQNPKANATTTATSNLQRPVQKTNTTTCRRAANRAARAPVVATLACQVVRGREGVMDGTEGDTDILYSPIRAEACAPFPSPSPPDCPAAGMPITSDMQELKAKGHQQLERG